jgi:hypothetical protein
MQDDTSQIPKLVEEISMLKLQVETLTRPGTQDNLLIQRFLDDTATYADSEYGDTASVMNNESSSTPSDDISLDWRSDKPAPRNPVRQPLSPVAHENAGRKGVRQKMKRS